MVTFLIIFLVILSLLAYGYKRFGMIKDSEEYYVRKFDLKTLKDVLVKADADNAEFIGPEKTPEDFDDNDEYVKYKIELAKTKNERKAIKAKSKPHVDKIKIWCTKHYDSFMTFINSKTKKVSYLDGSKVSPKKFYNTYMQGVSSEGKILVLKVCKG
tara:strand:- start:218 stop:688 length:471 start_codon:yes stop_codon:yes gene_type:complete